MEHIDTVQVGRSRNGKGIFTVRDFSEGNTLYEVTGTFITGDEDEDIDERARDNAFRYSKDLYITPGDSIGAYQNHSCDPNARVVKRRKSLYVVALRPILAGEEVSIDYSTITAPDDVWEMDCNCGALQCRKVIQNIATLPRAQRLQYIRKGMVPSYVAR